MQGLKQVEHFYIRDLQVLNQVFLKSNCKKLRRRIGMKSTVLALYFYEYCQLDSNNSLENICFRISHLISQPQIEMY